jgi:hypothetical protein
MFGVDVPMFYLFNGPYIVVPVLAAIGLIAQPGKAVTAGWPPWLQAVRQASVSSASPTEFSFRFGQSGTA